MISLRDRPQSLTPCPTVPLDLVAITTSSRRPRSPRPMSCSAGSRSAAAGAPGRSKTGMFPYTSAVSTKLMPRSSASPTSRSVCSAVGATPKVAVPSAIRDTLMPVEPRMEYCIHGFLFLCNGSGVVGGEGTGQLPERVRLVVERLGVLLGAFDDAGEGNEPGRRVVAFDPLYCPNPSRCRQGIGSVQPDGDPMG